MNLTNTPYHQTFRSTEAPSTFGQTTSGADIISWKMDMNAELEAQQKSDTWKLMSMVTALNIPTSRLVFEVMETQSTSETKIIAKAKFVPQGLYQID